MSGLSIHSVRFYCVALCGLLVISAGLANGAPKSVAQIRAAGSALRFTEQTALDLVATVTYFDRQRDLVVVQDATGAIAVRGSGEDFVLGEEVQFQADAYAVVCPEVKNFPFQPDRIVKLSSLKCESDQSRFYVDRIRGRVVVPATGDYTFFISSDDSGELWLSTDGDPEHAEKIATVAEWTLPNDFHRYPTQRSTPVRLHKGQVCYLEVMHDQQQGNSGLSVVWSGPEFDQQEIRAGKSISADASAGTPVGPTQTFFVREVWEHSAVGDLGDLSGGQRPLHEISLSHSRVMRRGHVTLDPPMAAEIAMANSSAYQRCSAEGVVQNLTLGVDVCSFQLTEGSGRFQVQLHGSVTAAEVQRLEGSRVRVTGVYKPLYGVRRTDPVAEILVPSLSELEKLSSNVSWDSLPTLCLTEGSALNAEGEVQKRIRGRVVARREDGSYLLRDSGHFVAFVSKDGQEWQRLGEELNIPLSDDVLAGFILSSYTSASPARATFNGTSGLAPLLSNQHVGDGAGESTMETVGQRITMTGCGGDTWDSFDDFQFLSGRLNGPCEISTCIEEFTTPHPAGKAGLMIRESLSPRSSFVEVIFLQGSVRLILRNKEPGSRGMSEAAIPAKLPYWVKLKRDFRSFVVRPESGSHLEQGSEVEVAGYAVVRGAVVEIDNAVVRKSALENSHVGATPSVRPLVPIAQVVGVPNRARPNALRLRGTLTFSGLYRDRHYIAVQDESGAMFISDNNDSDFFRPRIGQVVDIYGAPIFAQTADDLNASKIVPVGEGVMPTPVRHPAELLLPGNGAACWTEVEGVVFNVQRDGTALVRCNSGVVSIALLNGRPDFWKRYVDCLIRARGVIAYPEPSLPTLLVPDASQVVAVDSQPRVSSNIPIARLRDLNPTSFSSSDQHRIRVSGAITYVEPRMAVMQDERVAVVIQLAEASASKVGEAAVALGFPATNTRSLTLLEGELGSVGGRQHVEARSVKLGDLRSEALHGLLVKVSGVVTDQRSSEIGQILEIQNGTSSGVALLSTHSETLPQFPLGTRVEIVGVSLPERLLSGVSNRLTYDDSVPARVVLRAAQDVKILEHPAWWVVKRAAEVIAGLTIALLGLFTWVHILRRRVQQRTEQLEGAMVQLRKETEISTLLAERNRLAAEIHDSVEQGFSAVLLQLEVATRPQSPPERIRKSLELAHTMLVFSRGELRDAVWNLYSAELTQLDLPTSLERIVKRFDNVGVTFRWQLTGAVRLIGTNEEHHLLRIAQEAVANAVKHAKAETITISLDYDSDRLVLRVTDDGHGFNPEETLSPSLGHFGLRSLKTRAKKIHGQLNIISAPGRGCTVQVSVPLENPPIYGKDSDSVGRRSRADADGLVVGDTS